MMKKTRDIRRKDGIYNRVSYPVGVSTKREKILYVSVKTDKRVRGQMHNYAKWLPTPVFIPTTLTAFLSSNVVTPLVDN